jgi:hypothetical protein
VNSPQYDLLLHRGEIEEKCKNIPTLRLRLTKVVIDKVKRMKYMYSYPLLFVIVACVFAQQPPNLEIVEIWLDAADFSS